VTFLKRDFFLAIMFFLSGFCGLTYQTIWMRLAYSHFGITAPVMSVVISVFMFGLALGSWVGGKWISSLQSKLGLSALIFYAISECVIGIGGLLVPALFSWGKQMLFILGEVNSINYLFFSALFILLALLPWCFFMGTTFPLVMQFIREESPSEKKSFSFLYLANVIGACAGTLATAFVLVELMGFQKTLWISAGINFAIGLAGITWAFLFPYHKGTRPSVSPRQRVLVLSKNLKQKLPLFLFLTGLTSMGMEVAWVRNFTPVLGNEVYAFSGLLATYLLATWIGSWLYRYNLKNNKTVSIVAPTALLSVFSILPIALNDPNWPPLSHWQVLPSLIPFCATLGYLTPLIVDLWSEGSPERAGKGYAWNILGCIIGPLLASYFLLPFLGAKWTLIILAAPYLYLFFCVDNKKNISFARIVFSSCILLFLFSGFLTTSYEDGCDLGPGDRVEIRRDYTATVLSIQKRNSKDKELLINGFGATTLTPITKVMAHLPMMLSRQKPRRVLVICFGMGTTFRSLASWGMDTTAVELVPSVKDAFSFYFEDSRQILVNPNSRVVIDDGRRFLERMRENFDVITMDPMPPLESAGSSLLYSTDFYNVIKNHLVEGGLVHQWIPLKGVDKTSYQTIDGKSLRIKTPTWGEDKIIQAFIHSFVRSFPYVKAFRSFTGNDGIHLIGSMKPILIPEISEIISKTPRSAQEDLVEWNTPESFKNFLTRILSKEVEVGVILRPDAKWLVTDDRPFNEYYFLRRSFPSSTDL
jgi:spermidine synthase